MFALKKGICYTLKRVIFERKFYGIKEEINNAEFELQQDTQER